MGHFALSKRRGGDAIVSDHDSIDGRCLVVTVERGRGRREGGEGEVGTVIFPREASQSSILSFLAIVQCARLIVSDWLGRTARESKLMSERKENEWSKLGHGGMVSRFYI